MCAGQWELTSPWLPKEGIGALGKKKIPIFLCPVHLDHLAQLLWPGKQGII